MSLHRRRLAAAALVVAMAVSACGLDDGARVRNQDNVRAASESEP